MAIIFKFLWLTMGLEASRAVLTMRRLGCSELLPSAALKSTLL